MVHVGESSQNAIVSDMVQLNYHRLYRCMGSHEGPPAREGIRMPWKQEIKAVKTGVPFGNQTWQWKMDHS